MRRIRVYVDTSVFGGTQDEEFKVASERFFEQVKQGKYLVVVSEIALHEVSESPANVQSVLVNLSHESIVKVPASVEDEAKTLAEAYIAAGILGNANRADAMHVAVATVARADIILSWNFRHIVNYERIQQFNGVNAINGYSRMEIHSPLEMAYGDQNKNL